MSACFLCNQKEDKKTFANEIISRIINLGLKVEEEYINDILNGEQEILVKRARNLHKIPQDIAVNTPFKENLLTMFVCIFSRTPLFVCGKPGSSKTITVNILKKMFNSQKTSGELEFFDGFSRIKTEYYQGSEQSTDKGIDRIFRKALSSRQKNEQLPLVFIDEIGLAELSIHNPLKVLHKYLDSTTHEVVEFQDFEEDEIRSKMRRARMQDKVLGRKKQEKTQTSVQKQLKKWDLDFRGKVAFIGISNWNIDASKMNRNVYLARPDLDHLTLNDTGIIILKQKFKDFNSRTNEFKKAVRTIILRLAKTYQDFRDMQKVALTRRTSRTKISTHCATIIS